jgi:hypothetical protein
MFLLAHTLYTGDLAMPRSSRQLAGLRLFDSHDIYRTGVDVLAEQIKEFNKVHVKDPLRTAASYPSLDADDRADFIDIQDFADNLGDGIEEVDIT